MSKPWYRTARWKRMRLRQLQAEPLCRYCAAAGQVVPAAVVDHVVPHRGDPGLFWYGELQSLCKPHHDGAKQAEEAGRTAEQVGLDGYPAEAGRGQAPAPTHSFA